MMEKRLQVQNRTTLAFFPAVLKCWEHVRVEFMGMFHHFTVHGEFEKSLNATYVALIPKKSGAEDIWDFRPISDDTIIFCGADASQLGFLKGILICFAVVSGLKENVGKCEIIPVLEWWSMCTCRRRYWVVRLVLSLLLIWFFLWVQDGSLRRSGIRWLEDFRKGLRVGRGMIDENGKVDLI